MSASNDPSDGGLEPWNPDEFESALLGSIAGDAPPAGGRGKQLTMLAAASAATAGLTVTAAAGAKSGLLIKNVWLLSAVGCALVGGGIVTARWLGAERAASSEATAPVASAPRGASALPPPPVPAAIEVPTLSVHALPSAATNAASSAPGSAPVSPPAAGGAPSATEQEIVLLQAVRSDLGAGKTDAAIAALRAMDRVGSIRIFAPEARLLMIEALEAHGDRLEALERADAFLRDLPRDPHVSRVTRLRERMTNP